MVTRVVETRSIRMNVVEERTGPVLLFCHSFPETSRAWRYQLPALAAAGFRAVAPDMRGCGETEQPEAGNEYTVFHLVGDMVALMDALGGQTAIIVGSGWGATVAWQAVLMRPDRFRGVAAMSVPMMGQPPCRRLTSSRRPVKSSSMRCTSRSQASPRRSSSGTSGRRCASSSLQRPETPARGRRGMERPIRLGWCRGGMACWLPCRTRLVCRSGCQRPILRPTREPSLAPASAGPELLPQSGPQLVPAGFARRHEGRYPGAVHGR